MPNRRELASVSLAASAGRALKCASTSWDGSVWSASERAAFARAAAPARVDGVVTEGVGVRVVADAVAAADFVQLLRAEVAQARVGGFGRGGRAREG